VVSHWSTIGRRIVFIYRWWLINYLGRIRRWIVLIYRRRNRVGRWRNWWWDVCINIGRRIVLIYGWWDVWIERRWTWIRRWRNWWWDVCSNIGRRIVLIYGWWDV
jgi:hypothetical protein